jgi:four helix bundle protein
MEFDLEERTIKFSENIIDLIKSIKINEINKPIIRQLIRSSTSIGANYCEANGASSKRDFKNKIYICKKEAKETKYWLQLLAKTDPDRKPEIRNFWKEVQEFTLIFSKITITMSQNKNNKNLKF